MNDKYINIMRAIAMITFIALLIGTFIYDTQIYEEEINRRSQKPISLPEEIQAVQPNDTLVVSRVGDSIYIEFK
jgi:hypothetical protein